MARKSMKTAANEGTSVFDVVATGNTSNTAYVVDAPDAEPVKPVRPKMVRLNLLIPEDIKEYLQAAAYRESNPKHMFSLTEYFVKIAREDMERHKND